MYFHDRNGRYWETEFYQHFKLFLDQTLRRLLALVSMKSQLLEEKIGGGESLKVIYCNVLSYRCDKPVKIELLTEDHTFEYNRTGSRNHALRGF